MSYADGQLVMLAGVVTVSKTKTTKKNTLMAYVTLEDDTGSMELLCFTRVLENCGSCLKEGKVIAVRGKLSVRDEKSPQLLVDYAHPLVGGEPVGQAKSPAPPARTLYLRVPSANGPSMAHVRRVLFMFEGNTSPVKIRLSDTGKLLGAVCDVREPLLRELREKLGEENVVYK